jgi:hypothetical protein
MRVRHLLLSLAALLVLASLVATGQALDEQTATWYLNEGTSPSGLVMAQGYGTTVKGWSPCRVMSTKALTWYAPAQTGEIAGGTWAVNLWTTRPTAPTTLKFEVLKTDAKGENATVLGATEKALAMAPLHHNLANVFVKVGAATLKDERLALRVTKVTGNDISIAFNANDYNSSLVVVGTKPIEPPAGGLMNFTFINCTNKYTDDQISWTMDGRNYKTLAEGKVIPAATRAAARLYVRIKTPKTDKDPGETFDDFLEYNLSPNGIYINTTQVDGLVMPLTIEVVDAAGKSVKAGISESQAALLQAFKRETPEEFWSCLKGKAIVAPGSADFRPGGANADYFKAYIDEVWAKYATETKTPTGWTGKVVDEVLTFTSPDGRNTFKCDRKPTTLEIFACVGVLGNNPKFSGCINRHVLGDPAAWANPDGFYATSPCNYYSKFMHNHTINGKAYGFPYDDAEQQDTLLIATKPRPVNLIIAIYYNDLAPVTP